MNKPAQAVGASLEHHVGPLHGSAEEFATSEDPHCKDGGKACIDCLMRGACLMAADDARCDDDADGNASDGHETFMYIPEPQTPAEAQRDNLLSNTTATIPFDLATGLPRVPTSIIDLITAYGNARADGDVALCGERLSACITALRSLLSAPPPEMTPRRPLVPGWYWYALPGFWGLQPVLVSLYEGELWYCRDVIPERGPEDGYPLSECNENTLWGVEPITPPEIRRD